MLQVGEVPTERSLGEAVPRSVNLVLASDHRATLESLELLSCVYGMARAVGMEQLSAVVVGKAAA